MHRFAIHGAAAAFCVAALSAAPAVAQTRLSYADLNLNSSAGLEVFNARARNAARRTCGERLGPQTLREHMLVRSCKRAFIESAVSRIAPS
ncbi:MAG: UrcA family protein [Caulobacteraceae bacterium]